MPLSSSYTVHKCCKMLRLAASSSACVVRQKGLTPGFGRPQFHHALPLQPQTQVLRPPHVAVPVHPTWLCLARRKESREGFEYRRGDGKEVYITLNGTQITLQEDNLWMLVIPGVMLVGLAALIGPLIAGIALAAVGIGAAMSLGAFAMTLFWVPFAVFGVLFMTMLLPFGAFATFGLGLFLPKVLSLVWMLAFKLVWRMLLLQAIALGGVALGWGVVSNLLPKPAVTVDGSRAGGTKQSRRPGVDDGPVLNADVRSLDDEEEEELRRMQAELREFDELLSGKGKAGKRSTDEWDDWRGRQKSRF